MDARGRSDQEMRALVPQPLSVEEQRAQTLLHLLQARLAEKQVSDPNPIIYDASCHVGWGVCCQWLLAAGPAFYGSALDMETVHGLVLTVLECLEVRPTSTQCHIHNPS